MEAIPTVDIAAWAAPELHSDAERRATAAEWNDAMSTVGFGVVSGHGVGLELIEGMRAAAREFFAPAMGFIRGAVASGGRVTRAQTTFRLLPLA